MGTYWPQSLGWGHLQTLPVGCMLPTPHSRNTTHVHIYIRMFWRARFSWPTSTTVPTPTGRARGRGLQPLVQGRGQHHPCTPSPHQPPSSLPLSCPLAFGKLHHLLKDHPSFTGVGRDCYGSFCHHGNRCGLKGLRALIRLLGWEVIRTADQGDLYGAVREAPHQTSSLCLWGISRRGCM